VSETAPFGSADLERLAGLVADGWRRASDRDWTVPAGTLDWSCLATADHAVDCVYAPAFFLASRRLEGYPTACADLRLCADATPARLVESLEIATRILTAVVAATPTTARSILFQGPEPVVGAPGDFVPRGALELILHAHDVALGLEIPFTPPRDLCARLREHTRGWAMWRLLGPGLRAHDDPWTDLLVASGRATGR